MSEYRIIWAKNQRVMRTRETDIKMKDTNCKICLPNDHVHKDVVVIGE